MKRVIFVIICMVFIFGLRTYAEDVKEASSVNILIASQNSEYKHALVKDIAQRLKSGKYQTKIIDLNKILAENQADYKAVIIINSCWSGKQTRISRKFLNKLTKDEKQKVVVITTAKDIEWKNQVAGIDAVTAASKMNNIDSISKDILKKINAMQGVSKKPNSIALEKQVILGKGASSDTEEVKWLPSKEETEKALKAIEDFLKDQEKHKDCSDFSKEEIKKIIDDFPQYNVQFLGVLVNGQKIIHCNFFMAEGDIFSNWADEYISVFDGGYSFWRIDYDVTTGKCLNFESNGYA
ncbi:MAG: hypothetical protein ABIH18_09590 [Candidatus Omnitrophota bacterium]